MSLYSEDDYDEATPRHTELTLSSGVIVGALVGLVLLCGLFFWFGYSMRGGPKNSSLPTAQVIEPTSPEVTFNSFKPAAGSPLASSNSPTPASPTPASSANSVPIITRPPPPTPQPAPAAVVRPAAPAATSTPIAPVAQTASGFYVQIAAVSHQPDAEKLAARLHAEGYLVTARQAPQDNLFHVQIGPFATRQDADLIRQKLIGEGYTPIVK